MSFGWWEIFSKFRLLLFSPRTPPVDQTCIKSVHSLHPCSQLSTSTPQTYSISTIITYSPLLPSNSYESLIIPLHLWSLFIIFISTDLPLHPPHMHLQHLPVHSSCYVLTPIHLLVIYPNTPLLPSFFLPAPSLNNYISLLQPETCSDPFLHTLWAYSWPHFYCGFILLMRILVLRV